MNNEDVKKYIEKNGNARLVLDTLKIMQAEGAEMTFEELDKRLHSKPAPVIRPAPEPVRKENAPDPEKEPLIIIKFSEDDLKNTPSPTAETPIQPNPEETAPQPSRRGRSNRRGGKVKPAKKSMKETKRKPEPAVNTESIEPTEPKPKPLKKQKPKKEKKQKPPKEKTGDELLERLALIRTIASVVIALVLVLALAAILIMAVAPDSDIALFIDRLIDPVSSTFSLIEDARIFVA